MPCVPQWQIDFWTQRLAAKQALLAAYDAAQTALSTGVTQYTINTGQTTQTVTRASLSSIAALIKQLEREIQELMDALSGCDSRAAYVRPGF